MHLGGNAESTIIGHEQKTSCAQAAFANSTLGNILDFDDTYMRYAHPGSTVVPASFAIGEETNVSGKELITAVVLGYEILTRIGVALDSTIERKRFIDGNSTWQTFGGVTATGKLLHLNKSQMMNALGIAGANAPVLSGMKTVLNPLGPNMVKNNYGVASQVAVIAALLAKKGFTGPRNIFTGETGFWVMCGSDQYDSSKITHKLGEDYNIMDVSFKPFPTCRYLHSALEATMNVIREYDIEIDKIERIVIRTISAVCRSPFDNYDPKTLLNAQFSAPYSIAVSIYGIQTGPEWFVEENLRSSEILELAEKVELIRDTAADKAFFGTPSNLMATAEVHTKGKIYNNAITIPKGDPRNPLTKKELERKFKYQALRGLSKEKIEAAVDSIKKLEKISEIREVTEVLH